MYRRCKLRCGCTNRYNAIVSDLKGKTVLVTGAAKRLGKAVALAAAKSGAQVAFTYRNSEDDAKGTLKLIEQSGKGLAVSCDITNGESIAHAVRQVLDRFGQIDVLVNNAGIYETLQFEEITEAQWDRMFATNVRGPFLVSQHCIPALRKAQAQVSFYTSVIRANYITLGLVLLVAAGHMLPRRLHAPHFLVSWFETFSHILAQI